MAKNSFNLRSLPPTRDGAKQHTYRVYHQIQKWGDIHLEPTEWGWKRTVNGLLPVTTEKPAAPPALLKIISCNCQSGCKGNCGCRKHGLKCSIICSYCEGKTCSNVEAVGIDIEGDVDEHIDIDLEEFLNVEMSNEDDERTGEAEEIGDTEGTAEREEIEEPEIPMQVDLRHQPERKRRKLVK